jgi:hypothetical protein
MSSVAPSCLPMTTLETTRSRRARTNRAAAAWALLLLAAAVLSWRFPSTALDATRFVVASMIEMAPVVAIAAALTAAIAATGSGAHLRRVFEGRWLATIVAASAIGAVTPICGVGTLPLIAGLLGVGVPLAPVMAFWLSSPITDPAMLAITAGTLGLSFAVAKTVIALAIGLAGGVSTEIAVRAGLFAAPLRSRPMPAAACDSSDAAPAVWRFWREEQRRRLFVAEARASALLIAKWLLVAFALESLIRSHLPPELIAAFVGRDSDWAIPLAVIVGTPMYVDGYAALPLVRGLVEIGMAPGAAMAFLVAGGITSLYASAAVFALVRLRVFLWYLAQAMVGSTLGGYAYQAYDLLASGAF